MSIESNPFGGSDFEHEMAAKDKKESEIAMDVADAKMHKKKIIEDAEKGLIEIPEEIKESVDTASKKFWAEFDNYVNKTRAGESMRAPSRNRYIAEAQEGAMVEGDEDAMLLGYWMRLFAEEASARNIPSQEDEKGSIRVMNEILYEGKIPEEITVPE